MLMVCLKMKTTLSILLMHDRLTIDLLETRRHYDVIYSAKITKGIALLILCYKILKLLLN